MSYTPWRELAIPHEDVLRGTFQQAEFAADLSLVHEKQAAAEYQDSALFFRRTFITEGMRLLLDNVLRRLSGCGGDPVIQLQTAFGGGKTHTMLAVYHLAQAAVPVSELLGIAPILDAAGLTEVPRAQVAVLDGNRFSPGQPKMRDGIAVKTLWGDLAWQLGGQEAYQQVQGSDESGTAPDATVLQELLRQYQPVVILADELVRYLGQFQDGISYSGGTFESNLAFMQNLTQALKAVQQGVLLASLPESERSEAGARQGRQAMADLGQLWAKESLEKTFGRVQALWKPVATEEAFAIVRRRLFAQVDEGKAAAVCRAFADLYLAHGDAFPGETQESRYYERLCLSYPLHPEVFDRLYEDWSSLDGFQRTRGVLKLLAKMIFRLWKDGNRDLLIMPGSLPFYDADARNEALYYLPAGWDPVVEKDVDGPRAETTELDQKEGRFGSVEACRRVARTLFLGSAPGVSGRLAQGLEESRMLLGVVQPDQSPGLFQDALNRLRDRLHYLHADGERRYWFDTRPTLRREMEDRKRRFDDTQDVVPEIKERLQNTLRGGFWGGVHIFTPTADVPDDSRLRLVVLPLDAVCSRTSSTNATAKALGYVRQRGDQPRQQQNRLLFLAPEQDVVSRLRDAVRTLLAWKSIESDSRAMRLNLDQLQQRQVEESVGKTQTLVGRLVQESYKWLLAPYQDAQPGQKPSELSWEVLPLAGGTVLHQEIQRVIKENELVVTAWAPVHLSCMLKTWFWKDDVPAVKAQDLWKAMGAYLYLTRLADEPVFLRAIEDGTASREYFGLAQGMDEDRYADFSFGRARGIFYDSSLLLIAPNVAEAEEAARAAKEAADAAAKARPGIYGGESIGSGLIGGETKTGSSFQKPISGRPDVPTSGGAQPVQTRSKKRFHATVQLEPHQAKLQFADLVDEIVDLLRRPECKIQLTVEIEAEHERGFEESLQRSLRENCSTLGVVDAEFEEE